jgi:phosphate transport system permease protein
VLKKDSIIFSLALPWPLPSASDFCLIAIGLLIFLQSIPALREFGLNFLWTSSWNPVQEVYGALPMIYGTLVSSFLALLIAVPLGLGTAVFLSEDFIPLKIRTILVFMVELLAAIPSVVYGLWGIFVMIPALKWFFGLFGNQLYRSQYVGSGD